MNLKPFSYFIVLVLFFFSGMSALIHQVAWTRLLELTFGVSAFAAATVLASFMGGLAMGSYFFGKIADRRENPMKIFIMLEAGIGVYGLLMPALTGLVTLLYVKFGANMNLSGYALNILRFCLGFLVLAGPAALMGGTMPALFKFLNTEGSFVGRNSGNLYFSNNAGAVAGCLLAGFLLIKEIGVSRTIMFSSAVNFLVALAAFLAFRPAAAAVLKQPEAEAAPEKTSRLSKLALALFGIEGFVSLVYEITWIRILSATKLLNSVYSFAVVSATFITGLAIGGFIIARFVDRVKNTLFLFAAIEFLTGLSAVASLAAFKNSDYLISRLVPNIGSLFAGTAGYEALFSFIMMLVPAVLMGMLFPLVSRIFLAGTEESFGKIGVVGFYDTIGSVFGAFAAGFIFIRLLGMQGSILAMALVNFLLGMVLLFASGGKNKILKISVPALSALLFVPLFVNVSKNTLFWKKSAPKDELVYYREDAAATVMVTRSDTNEGKNLFMRINIVEVAGTGFMLQSAQKAQAHLPLLIYESINGRRAERVLQIGLGSGGTSWSAALHEPAEINCVELIPGVVDAAKRVFAEVHRNVFGRPFFRVIVEDGRNYLLRDKNKYDVIMTDSIHPLYAGNASLYSRDYFRLCRKKLTENGVIVVWLPMWKLSPGDFRMVLKTFQSVFPHATAWYLTNCLNRQVHLIGTVGETSINREAWFKNVLAMKEDLEPVNLGDPYKLLDAMLMSEDEVMEYSGYAQINTEDMPRLEFSAPLSYNYDLETWRDNLLGISKYRKNAYSYFASKNPSFGKADKAALQKYSDSSGLIMKGILKNMAADFEGSCGDFQKAYSINPPDRAIGWLLNQAKKFSLNRYISMGYEFLVNNLNEKAAACYRKALELDPESSEANEGMGIVYMRDGWYEMAIESFRKAILYGPDNFEPHLFLSMFSAEMGERKEALRELAEALRINHTSREPYAMLEQVFERTGLGEDARKLLAGRF